MASAITGSGEADGAGRQSGLRPWLSAACLVAAIYGMPLIYAADNWPNCVHQYLSDEHMAVLRPPDLDHN